MENRELKKLLKETLHSHQLVLAVFSHPRHREQGQKVSIRPILLKAKPLYQISTRVLEKEVHQNVEAETAFEKISESYLKGFKQVLLRTTTETLHILINKRGETKVKRQAVSSQPPSLSHNRPKQYLLKADQPVAFLSQLGIMNTQGKVLPGKEDKFRQINRFLDIVSDVVTHLDLTRPLHIVDFGCGKGYLTFALYHYLREMKGVEVDMIGLDLKEEVVHFCQELSCQLHYDQLQFQVGNINHYHPKKKVDMVITLHACDTATDAALEKAIRWGAEVILSVPCCQHELYGQLQNSSLQPILKHGILRERLAALATDAARAQILEILGYQSQVIEFIEMEHTAKNLMIKAVKRHTKTSVKEALRAYCEFKEALTIFPDLERRFSKELQAT
jgi:SAM-dependent methyltransferase